MRNLNIGLVGCGRIAERHASVLMGGNVPNARLVSVCDIDYKKAIALSAKTGVTAYPNMHDMMQKQALDVVAVLTESGNHAKHVCELAPYGKHIIVEKPMALTLEDADRIIYECDKYGIKLFVVKQNRFNLPVMKLREALEADRFGKIVMGSVRVRWMRKQDYYDRDKWRGTWALDGGVIANQASHHVDLLEWMLGRPISVFAYARTALVDIETEDTAIALVKFESGALGVIEATTAARPKDLEGSLSILGENGTVVIEGFSVNKIKTWEFDGEGLGEDFISEHSENPPTVYGYGHAAYYNNVTECILNNKQQLVDGLEGRKSLELISAIYESIETAKEVPLKFIPNRCRLGNAT